MVSLCQAVGPCVFFFFCDPLPPLSWSLEQLRINYPSRNKRPLTLEKLTIPSSPPCKKKSVGPPLFPCLFSPINTKREKGCFLVLRKLLLVSFCVVVWVLFSVFSIFCITSLVSATPRNHREKPLTSSRDAVIAPTDIKYLHRSYTGIFCSRCNCMQSAWLFVSFLSCNLIVLTTAPIQSHTQPQNRTKIMHFEKCAGISTK